MLLNIKSFIDAERAIKDLQHRLNLMETKDVDLRQRRIVNAHPSIDADDYVTRRELLQLEKTVQTQQQIVSSGGSRDYDIAVFGIAIAIPIVVMDDACPHHIVAAANGTIEKVFAKAKYPSVGGDIRLQVLKNRGTASEQTLFYITLPATSTAIVTLTTFVNNVLTEGDFLSINVLSIGTIYAGSTVILKIRYRWQ